MGFTKAQLQHCDHCKTGRLLVQESRKVNLYTRRRRACDSCSYKDTTYEVSSKFFEQAKINQKIVTKLSALVGGPAILRPLPPQQEIKCIKCHFNNRTSCSFELPEYDTQDAFDCIHFSLSYDK